MLCDIHHFLYLHDIHAYSIIILVPLFFLAGPHYVALAVLELLYRPDWPQIHRDPPVSTSSVLGLKAHTTKYGS